MWCCPPCNCAFPEILRMQIWSSGGALLVYAGWAAPLPCGAVCASRYGPMLLLQCPPSACPFLPLFSHVSLIAGSSQIGHDLYKADAIDLGFFEESEDLMRFPKIYQVASALARHSLPRENALRLSVKACHCHEVRYVSHLIPHCLRACLSVPLGLCLTAAA